jgi:hypothetical protein
LPKGTLRADENSAPPAKYRLDTSDKLKTRKIILQPSNQLLAAQVSRKQHGLAQTGV